MSRVLLRSLLALVLAAAAGLIAWRVLAPAEVLASATTPLPATFDRIPGVTGRTNIAPLIVDDQIRVYAAKRQVRADSPVGAKGVNTARWSFRRWPEQLSGVVASGRTVISRWSDGELIALDGSSGTIVWRAPGPTGPGFTGHRTGAQTVWAPTGLHVAGSTIVVANGKTLLGYAVSTGTRSWTVDLPDACTDGFTTAGGQYVCPTGAYDVASGQPVASWPAGPSTPLGCDVAASACAGLRDAAGQGWLTGAASPRRTPALDVPGSTVAAGLIFTPTGDGVQARDAAGKLIGTYPGAQVLGASADGIALLTAERSLAVADPRTGTVRAEFPLAIGTERLTWAPGRWQIAGQYLAIERLAPGGPADPEKPGHYFTVDTVLIAAM